MDKMVDKIPEWLKGKRLSDEALAELREVRRPVAILGLLSHDKVPDYLYPLLMAARMITHSAVYDDPVLDKARALRIIEMAREELKDAERRCRE